jgi:CubicO group peptidase (beta-lactamase class C family)
MLPKKTASLLLLLLFFIPSIQAQQTNRYSEQLANFERFVNEQMRADQIVGLSIGFVKGDFVWAQGFGYADLENKTPAKPESAYRLASVTKPMTAVAILQLVEAGKINLDAEVQTYVPYFPHKPWPVKVGPLLGHLAGIPHYVNYDLEGHFKDHKDTRAAIAVFENFDLVAQLELHPRVANLYDSIGEFYLNKGDTEQSISYYQKALEIDPNFQNAKTMLEKITAQSAANE